jgi:lantibiotic biosynthesis protein
MRFSPNSCVASRRRAHNANGCVQSPLVPTSRFVRRASSFFARRSFPSRQCQAWAAGIPGATPKDDARVLTERLRELIRDPTIREALFLASPSLNDAIDAWLADPFTSRSQGITPILVRYLTRMTLRPTPFGLFAGTTTGLLAERTRLRLAPVAHYRKHTRLDTHYLCALATALEQDETLCKELRYRPNSSLFALAGQFRYVEERVAPDTRERTFHLVVAEASELRWTPSFGSRRPFVKVEERSVFSSLLLHNIKD